MGRWYKYDKHHNRIFKKPLHGSLKPPSIPAPEWRKLGKESKKSVHEVWLKAKAADEEKAKLKKQLMEAQASKPSASSSSSSASVPAAVAGFGKRASKLSEYCLPMCMLMLSVFGCVANNAT